MWFKCTTILISFFFVQFCYSAELCNKILKDFSQQALKIEDPSQLSAKFQRRISPATDYLTEREHDVKTAFAPYEEAKADLLKKAKNKRQVEKLFQFYTENRSLLIEPALLKFIGISTDNKAIVERNSVYLSNESYQRAEKLGFEIYDIYSEARANGCETQEKLSSPNCFRYKTKLLGYQSVVLPLWQQAENNADAYRNLHAGVTETTLRFVRKLLSMRASISYETSRRENIKNYSLLTAIRNSGPPENLKVESYKLPDSNNAYLNFHILKNVRNEVVSIVFDSPLDTYFSDGCKSTTLLFDEVKSNSQYQTILFGNATSRYFVANSEKGLLKKYVTWQKENFAGHSIKETKKDNSWFNFLSTGK